MARAGQWLDLKDGGGASPLQTAGDRKTELCPPHASMGESQRRQGRSAVQAASVRHEPPTLPPAGTLVRGTGAPSAAAGATVSATVNVVAASASPAARGVPRAAAGSLRNPAAPSRTPSHRPARLMAEDIDVAHAALLRYTIKEEASLQQRLDSTAQRALRLRLQAAGESSRGRDGQTSRGAGGGGSSVGGFPSSVLSRAQDQTGPGAISPEDTAASSRCSWWPPMRARMQLVSSCCHRIVRHIARPVASDRCCPS